MSQCGQQGQDEDKSLLELLGQRCAPLRFGVGVGVVDPCQPGTWKSQEARTTCVQVGGYSTVDLFTNPGCLVHELKLSVSNDRSYDRAHTMLTEVRLVELVFQMMAISLSLMVVVSWARPTSTSPATLDRHGCSTVHPHAGDDLLIVFARSNRTAHMSIHTSCIPHSQPVHHSCS
jgi:hypothetical protein